MVKSRCSLSKSLLLLIPLLENIILFELVQFWNFFLYNFGVSKYTKHIFSSSKGSINCILDWVSVWKVKTNMWSQYSSQLWRVNTKTRHCHTSTRGSEAYIRTRDLDQPRRFWTGPGQALHSVPASYASDPIRPAERPSKSFRTTKGLCLLGRSSNPTFWQQSTRVVAWLFFLNASLGLFLS